MKFIGYECVFFGKINEIDILFIEKSNREISVYFTISRDTSQTKNETQMQAENRDGKNGR